MTAVLVRTSSVTNLGKRGCVVAILIASEYMPIPRARIAYACAG